MKQKLTAFILIVTIAGTSFNKAIVLLDYKLNNDFIAANLCENRNKPSCCCHGKCYLKKQLQKEEENGTKNIPASNAAFEVNLFCESAHCFYYLGVLKISFPESLVPSIPVILRPSVFQPPGRV